ncbi:hypothetical protein HYH02_003078 [Chlamydomonas schloesseri]|uniref:RING-type domain-containing protein n=1 Tax=Chlamydomonas schloesseri TaxID=2026947 RepID=A0A835WT09_9CHLO|nr:hypothetical protein HYH02_003078 [Chlamydomonas schloesseri]|eukprot:KAG2452040.1 hypothetical protein HYH02_003078 [Chlamydomonas schloesseri]
MSLDGMDSVVLERNSALQQGRASRSASQSGASAAIPGRHGLHRGSGSAPMGRPSPVPGLAPGPGATGGATLAPSASPARLPASSYSAASPAGALEAIQRQQRESGAGGGGGGGSAGANGTAGSGAGGDTTAVVAAHTSATGATTVTTTTAAATATSPTTTSQTAAVPAVAGAAPAAASAPPPAPPPPPPVISDHLASWINATDRRGRTPLATAVLHNRIEFVTRLIALGADPWARAPPKSDRVGCGAGMVGGGGSGAGGGGGGGARGGVTPLHLAAWLGHAPLVAEILKSRVPGPNPRRRLADVQDAYGFTPLHYAAAGGHADVADVLLAAGASAANPSVAAWPWGGDGHCTMPPLPGSSTGLRGVPRRLAAAVAGALSWAGDGEFAAALAGGAGGGGSSSLGASGRGRAVVAARSNPLHVAALRGDGCMVAVILRKYLTDTEGLSRQARERVPDPRRHLNKDGFQPYMLAGNAGHWHVAQMLIPFSRDNQLLTRDREFLMFFPLPQQTDAAAAVLGEQSVAGGGAAAVGPPALRDLASRALASALLTDLKAAESALRERDKERDKERERQTGERGGGAAAAAGAASGPAGVGAFGALLVRGLRAAAEAATSGGGMGRQSPGPNSPRASMSGARTPKRRSAELTAMVVNAGGHPAVTPRRSPSLEIIAAGTVTGSGAGAGTAGAQAVAVGGLGSPSGVASPVGGSSCSSLPRLAWCDVCFEAPQELCLRPCPHRLCAQCCRRVVEMHLLAPRAPAKSVPPRCPFCQATIRGFGLPPAPTCGAAAPPQRTVLLTSQPQLQLPLPPRALGSPTPAHQAAQTQLAQQEGGAAQAQPATLVQTAPASQLREAT